jgi:hypothetical protein
MCPASIRPAELSSDKYQQTALVQIVAKSQVTSSLEAVGQPGGTADPLNSDGNDNAGGLEKSCCPGADSQIERLHAALCDDCCNGTTTAGSRTISVFTAQAGQP